MKRKEFYDLAAEMEAACGDWENSEGLSEKAMSELIAKVEAMDAKANEPKCAESKPVAKAEKRFRLKKRYILILAAALVLVMGTGVVGDRAWIADSEDLERDCEVTTKVDNEDKENVPYQEDEVYQEIADKLGIAPMWLGYKPDGMVLDSYSIVEDTGWTYVNYLYNDNIVSIKMAKDDVEMSGNVQWDGTSREIKNISNVYGYEEIEAYCVDEENQNYAAGILYGNGYYNIFGAFSNEEEFIEILEKIYFKTM